MDRHTLKRIMTEQPFRPFVMHLADGRRLDIPSLDHISLSLKGRDAVVWEDDGGMRIIDVMMITEVCRSPEPV